MARVCLARRTGPPRALPDNAGMRHPFALLLLAACAGLSAQPLVPAAPPPEALPQCLQGLLPRARAAGVSAERFREFTGAVQADMGVVALLDNQPEFKTPIWD